MITKQEILEFIREDRISEKKRLARTGLKYYEGEHDILNYKLYFYNADGILVEDETRSNIKISHPFFTELVDQEVQYMLSGKSGFVKSDDPELQSVLDERFNYNEDFLSELYELLTGTISKGFDYMYAYKDKDDQLAFEWADSMGVVEVDGRYTSDKEDYVIYWYTEKVGKDRTEVKRIQVWDKTQTWYFYSLKDGEILDEESTEERPNPRPHIIYKKDHDETTYYDSLGFIPFFRLDNCAKKFSGLKPIKGLIDDYDLMSCGLSNNLEDASEYLVVVKGFQGDNLEELMTNIKTKKHIGVNGEDGGGVEFKTVDIPYQARKEKLELDEKNIYRFGMGFNSAQLGDGNITNVVIKSRYALLDLKCNKLEVRLKQFMRRILKIVLQEINDENGTDYQSKDVYFDFEREVMTNAQDNALIEKTDAETRQIEINTLLGLEGTIGTELVIDGICDVLDLDYEQIKDKLPDQNNGEEELRNALNRVINLEQETSASDGSAIESGAINA